MGMPLQFFVLVLDLFDEFSAHRTDTAYKQVQHLILRQEERIVQYIQGFPQVRPPYNERDVHFRCTLCQCNDADSRTSERAEELSADARRALHVLSHNGHGGKTALSIHGEHPSVLYLKPELLVQYIHGFHGIFVLHADRGVVL